MCSHIVGFFSLMHVEKRAFSVSQKHQPWPCFCKKEFCSKTRLLKTKCFSSTGDSDWGAVFQQGLLFDCSGFLLGQGSPLAGFRPGPGSLPEKKTCLGSQLCGEGQIKTADKLLSNLTHVIEKLPQKTIRGCTSVLMLMQHTYGTWSCVSWNVGPWSLMVLYPLLLPVLEPCIDTIPDKQEE